MNVQTLGKLIAYERNKNQISLQVLAEGLCSVSALQRLEGGERLLDFFVVERLLERLGTSINKMEFLFTETEYEFYYLRELIEKELVQNNYSEVEKALEDYQSRPEAEETLHRQYICKVWAVIEGQEKQNHAKAQHLLEEAMRRTMPWLEVSDVFPVSAMEKYLLGEGELLLFLMWLEERMEQDASCLRMDGRWMLYYIKQICKDEEARVNVYSKAAWVLGTLAILQNNLPEALWLTLQGEEILVNNGMLLHLPQYLERILFLTEQQNGNIYTEWKKQRDALKALYEEYGEPWGTERIMVWKNYRQQEVYLVSELLEQERRLLSMSQETLADALNIDQKTISRIESGKYKPKPGTFQKLKEYFGLDRDMCSMRIIVDDFSLLELEREIAKLNNFRKEAEAETLYLELKKQLSMQWNENRQYVRYMDTLFAHQLGRISNEEALEGCKEAFRMTRDVHLDSLENVVLNRMEAFIVNYMALCYNKMGQKEKAIVLREKMLRAYENSKVDMKYHYVAVALISGNLADDYEVSDRFEEAIAMCDWAISFALRCKRSSNIGFLYEEKQYTIDRMTGERASGKKVYQQAYQILKLLKREREMNSLQNMYQKWYGEMID